MIVKLFCTTLLIILMATNVAGLTISYRHGDGLEVLFRALFVSAFAALLFWLVTA